ncbi:uncharacterized protein LOC110853057 [Folsomia candida]|uniref:Galectin n=1 Tax=Folsomia candida TaxID=158441 RepID=A0A226DZM1_FOLCA|nr:uncharacterized protein LOC110853057 [Folsomia candida]OXA50922.1 32 kDa beta-galactoside-binding lectin [Folsomia candida]
MQGSILILEKQPNIPYDCAATLLYANLSYKIIIRGTVSEDPAQFAIDIRDDQGAILLHVNPRWTERRIIMNACSPIRGGIGGWGLQEYAPMNMRRSEPFEITIKDKDDYFWIVVNNEIEVSFKKRLVPLSARRHISVNKVDRDDITLNFVQMDEFPK